MFIINLEEMVLYEITTNRPCSAPRGLLVWDKYEAINIFREHLKKMAEEIQPDLKGKYLYNLALIDGKICSITNKKPIELQGNERIEHFNRFIDFYRVIINNFNKDIKVKLNYIKM